MLANEFDDELLPIHLVDLGLGLTAVEGLTLAVRLVDFGDDRMTTGGGLPLSLEALVEVTMLLFARFGDRGPEAMADLDPDEAAVFAGIVIATALDWNAAEEFGEVDVTAPGFDPMAPAFDLADPEFDLDAPFRLKPRRGVAQLPTKTGKPRKPKGKPKKKR